MKALVFHGPNRLAFEDRPKLAIEQATDAIVRITTTTICGTDLDGKAAERVMALTHAAGVDVAIEAVGLPATFDICQAIIAPGGRIANVGFTPNRSSSTLKGFGPRISR